MKNSALVLGLFMLLSSFSLFAQEDSRPVSSNLEHNDDSLTVVIPATGTASLSLITPPDGFKPTDKFNGYLHLEASSGIIMTMIENASYVSISDGMTEDWYKANGLNFIEKKEFVSDNSINGNYFKFSFETGDIEFIRYMVYAGDLNNTLWLNITYPTKYEALMEREILQTIQSIKLKATSDEK